MKIIISPSKTQNFLNVVRDNTSRSIFTDKTNQIVDHISSLSKEEVTKRLKVKGKLLQRTYEQYQNYGYAVENPALFSYTGEVFKQLDVDSYSKDDIIFLQNHLLILSALYGVLKPFDIIKPYRLDMKMNIWDYQSLYTYWQDEVTSVFKHEDIIINLASNEFSKMVKKPMTTIQFKEIGADGKYRTIGIYSKKARGAMLNYIIKNKIDSVQQLKCFRENNYRWDRALSHDDIYVYTR